MHTQTLVYQEDQANLKGFVAYDDASQEKRPAVLIVHAWEGRDPFVDQKAREMAQLGYVGFAVDVYGEGKLGETTEEKRALIQPFLEDRALLLKRLEAALEIIKTLECVDASRIAIMGYCFGGLSALDLARSGADIKGAVSLHGSFTPSDLPKHNITAKILALHGHDDPITPPEMEHAFAKEFSEAKCDWQLHVFGNTLHSFTNPEANDLELGLKYSPSADARSQRLVQDFFEEIF